jgi:ElaB/YqjD/DUF883 family membrane-anchored ribosome-binding protein
MTEDEREIERLRTELRQSLRRVPERINGASIQAVRDYKEAYKRASKLVDKSKATAHELRMTINQVT